MSESRSELLAWLNELLQINYNKVEQCGTGGAYCQILDSIYRKSFPTALPACPLGVLLKSFGTHSGHPNDARQNECEARIRIYSEF